MKGDIITSINRGESSIEECEKAEEKNEGKRKIKNT